jgi:hypothetical protein
LLIPILAPAISFEVSVSSDTQRGVLAGIRFFFGVWTSVNPSYIVEVNWKAPGYDPDIKPKLPFSSLFLLFICCPIYGFSRGFQSFQLRLGMLRGCFQVRMCCYGECCPACG